MNRRSFLRYSSSALALAATSRGTMFAEAGKSTAAKAVADGNSAFAFDLYSRLKGEGNLFFSPFSVSAALAMTSAGTAGDTLDETAKTLRFPDQGTLHAGFGSILKTLNPPAAPGDAKRKRGYDLRIANALWVQANFALVPAFVELAGRDYGAGAKLVDFAGNPDAARGRINKWVEERTADKIKDLFPSGTIDALTRLVLTNAVYFKGAWTTPFVKEATRDEPFKLSGGSTVPAPTMRVSGRFGYSEGESWQAISLPYAGSKVSMVVVLPKAVDGLSALEKSFGTADFAKVTTAMKPEQVNLALPKFKATAEFALDKTLPAMGMAKAFAPGLADFSRLHVGDELYIQKVVHKAFVDVTEQGTEAAAATGVAVGLRSMPAPPRDPKEFKADHPFLIAIRDEETASVLFLGRVAKP